MATRTAIEERLALSGTRLNPSRRRLIQSTLENPDETFYLSSRAMARRYKVDQATIVRSVEGRTRTYRPPRGTVGSTPRRPSSLANSSGTPSISATWGRVRSRSGSSKCGLALLALGAVRRDSTTA